jgi:hypothetical protein
VDLSATSYYHCISTCVRRAFLCGRDPYTGESYEHRKPWVRDRLHELTGVFAIDVCAYAILSNRFHAVLRVDLERAATWPGSEVMHRYTTLHPMALPAWEQDRTRKGRAELVDTWRARLADISWMMRVLREHIARKANREDKVRGRFWEGRFKSQPVLDDRGLVVCMAYVDLAPMRAGIASTLELSEFTSIQERLRDKSNKRVSRRTHSAPRGLVPMAAQDSSRAAGSRLPFGLRDYRALLAWTASARRGAAQTGRPPVLLARAGIDPTAWLRAFEDERVEAAACLGTPEAVTAYAEAHGRAWSRGVGLARGLAVSAET